MNAKLKTFKMAHHFKSDLQKEFNGYNFNTFRADVLAGLTVTAVALPLALAFGVSSGADAAAGLITAIVAAFIIGSLSGASFQISGPTGAMAAILIPIASRFGLQTVLMAGLISGFILIVAGVLKIGSIMSFIPRAVITGFTSGIAIIISLGQVENFLGLKSHGINGLERVFNLFSLGSLPNFSAVCVGLFVVIFMVLWPKKWGKIMPASLVSLLVVTAVNLLFNLPIETVGLIPKALIHENRLTLNSFFNVRLNDVVLPAISIAALGMIESLLCGTAAGKMKGERINCNQELVAQGVGNIVLPFLGGVPATAAIARTSVGIKSGGKTRLTGILHGVFLLCSMFLLAPFMSKIPLSALAGVLMVTTFHMNDWKSIHYFFHKKFKTAILGFVVTLLCTVVFDLTVAIVIGCLASMLIFIHQLSKINIHIKPLKENNNVQLINISGALFFGSIDFFEEQIQQVNGQTLIFLMQDTSVVDISGAQSILEFCEKKQKEGVTLLFCALQPKVKAIFDKADVSHLVGHKCFFTTVDEALESLAL